MDITGFFNDAAERGLYQEFVYLEGDKAATFGWEEEQRETGYAPITLVNPEVAPGDWVIPLEMSESDIVVDRVDRVQEVRGDRRLRLQGNALYHPSRWLKVARDVSQDDGWLEWKLRLRESVLMRRLMDEFGSRNWGDDFVKVMTNAGVELPRAVALFELRFGVRFGSATSVENLLKEEVVSSVRGRLVDTRLSMRAEVRVTGSAASCECESLRREYPGQLAEYSNQLRSMSDRLSPITPDRGSVVEAEVRRIRCCYCD